MVHLHLLIPLEHEHLAPIHKLRLRDSRLSEKINDAAVRELLPHVFVLKPNHHEAIGKLLPPRACLRESDRSVAVPEHCSVGFGVLAQKGGVAAQVLRWRVH